MSVDRPAKVAAARERLRAEETVSGLLGATAGAYVELLDAPTCTISRVIGDLLVDLVQHQKDGGRRPDVGDRRRRRGVGLVEIYGEKGRHFKDEEVELAQDLAEEVGEILKQLEPADPVVPSCA